MRKTLRRIFAITFTAVMLVGLLPALPGGFGAQRQAYAASNKLELEGTPTVYVQSGGEAIVSIKVKNISGGELKGVNMTNGYPSTDDYFDDINFFSASSEQSTAEPASGDESTWYRFSNWFEKSGYDAVNATWDGEEEGYTIGSGKTATLWFKVRSRYEEPGTYNEWIKLVDSHTEMIGGFYPLPIIDEELTGPCQVKVNVYNPSAAALTVGTKTAAWGSITPVPLGSTIDFGTIDLSKETGLTAEKTYYTRNTTAISSTGKDEHGYTQNIEVGFGLETPHLVKWSYEHPFGLNDHLSYGQHWSPLEPATDTQFMEAEAGITLDVTDYVAGTYTATFVLNSMPHGVKVNGAAIHTNGRYTWPVTVTLTGTNPRIPAAPEDLTATAGNGQVELTWMAQDAATGKEFQVFRREGSESQANINKKDTAQFNWADYEFVGSDTTNDEGAGLFVDGTAENGKTYTYAVIGGDPYKAYPEISSPVTPSSSLQQKLEAPGDFFAENEAGGVLLTWEMSENYGGSENDGSAMVDHFNVYRNGRLVKRVYQNAVIGTRNDYGNRTDYSWEVFVDTPHLNQDYAWQVSAVSKSGVEGYLTDPFPCGGYSDEISIVSCRAEFDMKYDEETEKMIPVITVEPYCYPDTSAEIRYWRSEGTTVPDTSQSPYKVLAGTGELFLTDKNITKGKTYTYTMQAIGIDGDVSGYHTVKVKAADFGAQEYCLYEPLANRANSPSLNWQIVNGRIVRMSWGADTIWIDDDTYGPVGTYKVYRNGVCVKTISPAPSDDYNMSYEDIPLTDGTYTYRVDKIINGITVTGQEFVFDRDTTAVDESTFLQPPSAPVLDVRVSDSIPVLRWYPTDEGGEVQGYHIYRKDAGEFENGYVRRQDAPWLSPYTAHWPNNRYITIDDPDARVLTDVYGTYQDDPYKGSLTGINWYENDCPHEYWITAYNEAGESVPSRVFTFEYQGEDPDTGMVVAPTNEDEYPPAAPRITKTWVEWDDEESGAAWDDAIGGEIHVAWDDPAETAGAIDRWDVRFEDPASGEDNTISLDAWEAAKDPGATQGTSSYSPTDYVSAGSESSDDYGHTFHVTVTAANSAGGTASEPVDLLICSFPRTRAVADNGRVKISWTDLFRDPDTQVDSWEIWRKGEYGLWQRIKTFDAAALEPNETGVEGYNQPMEYYSWYDEDVTNGWTYQYKVVAKCADGIDRAGVVRSARPAGTEAAEEPGAPQDLRYQIVKGVVQFQWTAPAEGGAPDMYYVKYLDKQSGNEYYGWYTASYVNASSTYVGWMPDKPGTYKCFVYGSRYMNGRDRPYCPWPWEIDHDGWTSWQAEENLSHLDELYPNHSNVVEVTITQAQIDSRDTEYVGEFTLSAEPGTGQVQLTWSASEHASYYEIQRIFARTGYADEDFPTVTVPASTRTYTDTTAEPGVLYQYEVTAVGLGGRRSETAYARVDGQSRDDIIAASVAELIAALPDPDDLTQQNYQEYAEQINEVGGIYSGLTKTQKALLEEEARTKIEVLTSKLETLELAAQYAEVVAPVQALIDALPDADTITEASLQDEALMEQITAARRAYSNIHPAEAKKLVDTTKLTAAENKVAYWQQIIEDRAAYQAVIDQINELPDPATVNEENYGTAEEAALSARGAYNSLTVSQKASMSADPQGAAALTKLEDLETKIRTIKDQIAQDRLAAQNVEIQIAVLPEPGDVRLADAQAIQAASEAYDALTAKQKAYVGQEYKDKLTACGQRLALLQEADVVSGLIAALPGVTSITAEDEDAIEAARAAYNGLSEGAKALIPASDLAKLETAESTLVIVKKQAANETAAVTFEKQMAALPALVSRIGELQTQLDDLLAAVGDEAGNAEDITDISAELAALQTQLTAITDAYDGLTAEQKALVENAASIAEAEQALGRALTAADDYTKTAAERETAHAADLAAARIVIDTIDALPAAADISLDDEDAITAARSAYNGLTLQQKALVENAGSLIAAEQALGEKQTAEEMKEIDAIKKQEADAAAAKTVTDLLADLPGMSAVTIGDEDAILAARQAYDALTDDQKALVPEAQLAKLQELEAWLDEQVFPLAGADVFGIGPVTYTGKAVTHDITVVLNGKTLTEGKDYTVSYENNVNAGQDASVTIEGMGHYNGTITQTFTIEPKKIAPTVTVAAKTWTGKVLTPTVTVKAGSTKLTTASYTKTVAAGRKNVGRYKVTVKLKGNYTGTTTVYFKINPKGTTLGTLSKAKKAATIRWKKQATKMSSSRISGYQIELATNSKFTTGKKTVTVAGYSKTSKKVTGLKGGKKYYVHIRTYKTVSGVKYYSPWSKTKTVTTKK